MSEPKRFNPVSNCTDGTMTVNSSGDYIAYESYVDLQCDLDIAQARVDELTAKLKQRDFQDEVLEETGRLLDKSQAQVDALTAENKILSDFEKRRIYASPERFKQLWAAEVKAERYRKCLQRIVDEGWDRYGCAEALKEVE